MKKILLLLICLMLCGCTTRKAKDDVADELTGNKYTFVRDTDNKDYKMIYEFEDGRKVYSEFKEINYEDFDKDIKKIKLEEALAKGYLSIDDILKDMNMVSAANDGGSKIYQFMTGENQYLVVCNTLDGNKNIIIGTSLNIIDKCVE